MARFHVKHGTKVELQDELRTAVRTSRGGHTVVFSACPLIQGVTFEVNVGAVGIPEYMTVGVTSRDPASLPEVPNWAHDVLDSRVVYRGEVCTCGEEPGDRSQTGTYPDDLKVSPGDRVGVSHSRTSVYIHRDGRRLAPLWEDVTRPVWVVIELVQVIQLTVVQPGESRHQKGPCPTRPVPIMRRMGPKVSSGMSRASIKDIKHIKDIEKHLSPETTSDEQFYMIRQMTTLYHLWKNSDPSFLCARIIHILVRLAMGPQRSGKLEELVVGNKVRSMIADLAKMVSDPPKKSWFRAIPQKDDTSERPTNIVRALTSSVQHKEVTGERLTAIGGKLIHKWFCDDHGKLVIKTEPGFIQSLPTFFEACLKKEKLKGGRVEGGKYIDVDLRPVIKGCLENETTNTIDAADDSSMSISKFAITWGLSGVIQELLIMWSCPNAITNNVMIWDCLTQIVHATVKPRVSQLMEDAIKGLVSNGSFNVDAMTEDNDSCLLRLLTSAKNENIDNYVSTFLLAADRHGKSILDHCIDKCQNTPSLELGLSLMAEIGANTYLTPQKIRHCLAKLCKIKPEPAQVPVYKATIKALASNAKYNVNEVLDEDEGWTIGHLLAKEGNAEAMKALLEVKTFEVNKKDSRENSALFHLCKTFKPTIVMNMIDSGRWSIDVKNKAGDNLFDFYMATEHPDRELAKYISNKLDIPLGKSPSQSMSTTFGSESKADSLLPAARSGQGAMASFPARLVKTERKIKCDYWRVCAAYLDSLKIPDAYFEPKFDYCYCDKCMKSRGDELYYTRGVPRKTYGLPVGWARFGLSLPPQAEAHDIFNKWHVGYHGTVPDRLESILHSKDLLMPGDVPFKGSAELRPPTGHFTDDSKPDGFDIKQVFVTPSMKYAGHGAYAKVCSWTDPDSKEKFKARVALQVRIDPGSYKVGRETVGAGTRLIDEGFTNEELEWSTKQRGAIILTGILVSLKV